MTVLRWLLDPPATGARNMAVDESLWVHAGRVGVPVLRFYSWAPATVSVGYFQSHHERATHQPSLRIPWVRRSTGGGAIVHDVELTYSLAWPLRDQPRRDSTWLYELVHQSLVEVLRRVGVELELNEVPSADRPFLCFQRRARLDGLIDGAKVLGSAQRRNRRAIMQHGSLLWETSEFAPELSGICEMADVGVSRTWLAEQWSHELAVRLNCDLQRSALGEAECALAARLEAQKYGQQGWNQRR